MIQSSLPRRGLLAIGAASVLLPQHARAETYPSRTITLVVPFASGGTGDIVARTIAPALGHRLGREVIVENKAGAGGAIGWAGVAGAGKDGYTLLATDTSFVMAAALMPKQTFDPRRSFTHVGTTASVPFVVVVGPSTPFKTLGELIAFAKANPGKLNYGSGGNGSSSHLGGEWFKSLTGTFMTHVAYRGGSGAINDLMGGHVDVVFPAVPSVLSHVRSGKLRALAVSSATRSVALPDVQSAKEAGLPKFMGVNWFGLSAPAGTPDAIVQRLNTELNAVLTSPDIKERLAGLGLDPMSSSQPRTATFVDEEIQRWSNVVRGANIKPD